MTVCLYGAAQGESSAVQVTRGLAGALGAQGQLAGVVALDQSDSEYDCGARGSAPVALAVGQIAAIREAHRRGHHERHWLLLAPNSETLPRGFVDELIATSAVLPRGYLTGGLLAPSEWAAGVLRQHFPRHRVLVAPHGVTRNAYRPPALPCEERRQTYRAEQFHVLHCTSTVSDRKGTAALLAGWSLARQQRLLPDGARLGVLASVLVRSQLDWWIDESGLPRREVVTLPGFTMPRHRVDGLYRTVHLIAQPSRGEGFGMVPLEALTVGTPVVVTRATGHSQVFRAARAGAVIVEHCGLGPTDEFPGALAPAVAPEAVCTALGRAYAEWEALTAAAEAAAASLCDEWSWDAQSGPALRAIVEDQQHGTASEP